MLSSSGNVKEAHVSHVREGRLDTGQEPSKFLSTEINVKGTRTCNKDVSVV